MPPKVTLVSWTQDPIGTIYKLWEASKSNRPYREIEKELAEADNNPAIETVRSIFEKVVDSKIPVAENIDFIFLLENVSISFREQMVRHRIGVKVGDRIGVDIVPDLADSTWWSQSMRILDMGDFAANGRFHQPEGISELAAKRFRTAMRAAEDGYNDLLELGVSMEKAREVIPLAATHRISWKLNLSALQHIVGKRGCWILQGDLWEPVIRGMVEELATKVDPYFRTLIAPPCVKNGKFVSCSFKLDNERRVSGEDSIPPCALYLKGEKKTWEVPSPGAIGRFDEMVVRYESLWGKTCEELTS